MKRPRLLRPTRLSVCPFLEAPLCPLEPHLLRVQLEEVVPSQPSVPMGRPLSHTVCGGGGVPSQPSVCAGPAPERRVFFRGAEGPVAPPHPQTPSCGRNTSSGIEHVYSASVSQQMTGMHCPGKPLQAVRAPPRPSDPLSPLGSLLDVRGEAAEGKPQRPSAQPPGRQQPGARGPQARGRRLHWAALPGSLRSDSITRRLVIPKCQLPFKRQFS